MSSSALQIKPEDISTHEKRGKYTISVIDDGLTGILHAYFFAEAGFKVFCVELEQTLADRIMKGVMFFPEPNIEKAVKNHVKSSHIIATHDVKTAVSQSEVIMITIPVKVDEKKRPDYTQIKNLCKQVATCLQQGALVIIATTMGIGSTEEVIKIIEDASGFKVGSDIGLAYSPCIISLSATPVETQARIVAADDELSLNSSATILETITPKNLRKVRNIKTAEAALLFKAAQKNMESALNNELAAFCEKAKIDLLEASEIVNSLRHGKLAIPTFSDTGTQKGISILLGDSENLDAPLRLTRASQSINSELARRTINLVKDALHNSNKTMRRARVTLLGIAQAPDRKILPNRKVNELVKIMEKRGIRLGIYDPYFTKDDLPDFQKYVKKTLNEALEGSDCAIILTAHTQFRRLDLKKLKILMRMPATIVDLEAVFDPRKVEKEGFIYRGLGRGVWTR
ncbi:MAG: nucleotide sugar dehydrogenase [Candidatus Bathyarchaeota archaeon]|jgi:nucleotide sugar dehydrogenase|nr:nucleotide sugar dehydrogenase [Candidatus Bathyarchaeota archaeon]